MYKKFYNHFVQILRDKNNVRLLTNFLSLISLKGVDFIIPLVILPFLVRTLGLSYYGLTTFSLSLSMYFGALIHYGYSITAVRDIARVRDKKELLSIKYSTFLSTSLLLALLSLTILLAVLAIVPSLRQNWVLHLFSFFYIAMQSIFPSWFFQGVEKMKYIAYINLSTKVLYLFSLWLLVNSPEDYILVPLLNGIAMGISTIVSLILIKKIFHIDFRLTNFNNIKKVLIDGRHAFLAQFSPTLYNSSAVFLLGYTSTNTIVGIYTSATKLIDALNSLAVLISTTFLPYLSINLKKHKKFSFIMLASGVVLSTTTFIFSEQIVLFLFSKENIIVAKYLKMLTPMVLFIFIRFTYGPNFLMLVGKEALYRNVVLLSCIVFFAIAIYIVPKYEIYGAISILIGTTFTMALLTYIYYNKFKKNILSFKEDKELTKEI